MKTLVFHIFIFALVAFASASCNSAKKIGSHYDHYQTCLTELGVTEDELFSVGEVTNGQHKTKHEDTKQHKNGCIMQCVFEKLGLMIGADFDEEKMREYYIKEKGLQPGDQRIDFLSSCMEQTKNMEDKCDKSLGFIGCALMNEVSLPASNEEA